MPRYRSNSSLFRRQFVSRRDIDGPMSVVSPRKKKKKKYRYDCLIFFPLILRGCGLIDYEDVPFKWYLRGSCCFLCGKNFSPFFFLPLLFIDRLLLIFSFKIHDTPSIIFQDKFPEIFFTTKFPSIEYQFFKHFFFHR